MHNTKESLSQPSLVYEKKLKQVIQYITGVLCSTLNKAIRDEENMVISAKFPENKKLECVCHSDRIKRSKILMQSCGQF